MKIRAIFFDKDGTLIQNIPFNVDPEKIKFSEGAEKALCSLKKHFDFHIITNQGGVARGFFDEKALEGVRERLSSMFTQVGAELKGFHYCPHDLKGTVKEYAIQCDCKKPLPSLINRAALNNGIDLSSSWMIGDILDDIEAGKRAGCKTILLDVGNETEWIMDSWREPHYTVKNLFEAAEVILQEQELQNE